MMSLRALNMLPKMAKTMPATKCAGFGPRHHGLEHLRGQRSAAVVNPLPLLYDVI